MAIAINRDELLWLLTAHPDTGEPMEDAPAFLIAECKAKGLVTGDAEPYRLTERGWSVRDKALNGLLPGQG